MNQLLKTTNYLTPRLMYGDGGFLDWLVRLEPFHNDKDKEPMSANQFYWCARVQYGSALRITEALKLTKSDIDLNHRILTIRSPKTNKGGMQRTSIMPYDIEQLEKFLQPFKDDERLFPTTRSTMWRYYKNASILGGLPIFEAKPQINIEGAWTHLMRSSCAKLYEDKGAIFSLIQCKLRHNLRSHPSATDRYTKRDLSSLIEFDDEHFQEIPFDLGDRHPRNEVL